jgi:hypothetical protein
MAREMQFISMPRRRYKRDPTAQQNGLNRHFHAVYEARVEKPPEQHTASEQPNVFPRLRTQLLDRLLGISTDDHDLWMVFLPERCREHNGAHTGHGRAPCVDHCLEGPAPDQQRVELRHQLAEVCFWIWHDPVGLALRTCDVAVQANHPAESDPFHRISTAQLCDLANVLQVDGGNRLADHPGALISIALFTPPTVRYRFLFWFLVPAHRGGTPASSARPFAFLAHRPSDLGVLMAMPTYGYVWVVRPTPSFNRGDS